MRREIRELSVGSSPVAADRDLVNLLYIFDLVGIVELEGEPSCQLVAVGEYATLSRKVLALTHSRIGIEGYRLVRVAVGPIALHRVADILRLSRRRIASAQASGPLTSFEAYRETDTVRGRQLYHLEAAVERD